MTRSLIISFLAFLPAHLHAQSTLPCGSHELKLAMLAKIPSLQSSLDSVENKVASKVKEYETGKIQFPGAPYRIQTVVHVLGTNAATMPASDSIRRMIDSINRNLGGLDPDLANLPAAFNNEMAGNIPIQLCLTDIDPNGFPTDGIIRTTTTTNNYFINYGTNWASFMSATDPVMGGINIWDRNRYLNIIITPTLFDSSGGPTSERVGVSSFPGYPADKDCYIVRWANMLQDGAHTHELGHWLNLKHIWGDDDDDADPSNDCNGSDDVTDTPNQSTDSQQRGSGCSFPQLSCTNGPDGDMYMNYMDYSNCYSMFTNGQETRMIATLDGTRASVFGTNCTNDITLIAPVNGMHRAANTIQTAGSVVSNNTANLQAGNKITLTNGFRATNGSSTRIYLKPCCPNQ